MVSVVPGKSKSKWFSHQDSGCLLQAQIAMAEIIFSWEFLPMETTSTLSSLSFIPPEVQNSCSPPPQIISQPKPWYCDRSGVWVRPGGEALWFLPNTRSWRCRAQITLRAGGLLSNHERRLVLPTLAGLHYFTCYHFWWIDRTKGVSCPRYVLALTYRMRCSWAEQPSMHRLIRAN